LPVAVQVEVLRYVAKVNCGEPEKCFWYLVETSLDGQ
jgi:hypothetical protein